MTTPDLLAGLAIVVGLVGIVVPFLPGTLLVAAAVLGWAVAVGEPLGWSLAAAALVVLALGTVVKYAVPGRSLKVAGVPNRTLLLGAALGVIGFFVIPVVGLVVGFVAGIYLSEAQRLGREAAWPATKVALRAVGLSILIEVAAALVATALWLTAVVVV
ncbi:MAG TPA: DUF456 domain-containing protein [Marmoricola sp.]|nr:DUF456 domain-containing protein [Marmoricola sp.]